MTAAFEEIAIAEQVAALEAMPEPEPMTEEDWLAVERATCQHDAEQARAQLLRGTCTRCGEFCADLVPIGSRGVCGECAAEVAP